MRFAVLAGLLVLGVLSCSSFGADEPSAADAGGAIDAGADVTTAPIPDAAV